MSWFHLPPQREHTVSVPLLSKVHFLHIQDSEELLLEVMELMLLLLPPWDDCEVNGWKSYKHFLFKQSRVQK